MKHQRIVFVLVTAVLFLSARAYPRGEKSEKNSSSPLAESVEAFLGRWNLNAACAHIGMKIWPVIAKIVSNTSPTTVACSVPASPCTASGFADDDGTCPASRMMIRPCQEGDLRVAGGRFTALASALRFFQSTAAPAQPP
jgi:hypothetical protein